MENNKKMNEPFDPQRTPEPPQVKDPGMREENRKKQDVKRPDPKNEGRPEAPAEGESKPKMLGDETEITDETTI
jgi:hypothetical protein